MSKLETTPCDGCGHESFCREHGCTAWNDEARRQWDAGKVIDMNNLAIGLTPYLPPFPPTKYSF